MTDLESRVAALEALLTSPGTPPRPDLSDEGIALLCRSAAEVSRSHLHLYAVGPWQMVNDTTQERRTLGGEEAVRIHYADTVTWLTLHVGPIFQGSIRARGDHRAAFVRLVDDVLLPMLGVRQVETP